MNYKNAFYEKWYNLRLLFHSFHYKTSKTKTNLIPI